MDGRKRRGLWAALTASVLLALAVWLLTSPGGESSERDDSAHSEHAAHAQGLEPAHAQGLEQGAFDDASQDAGSVVVHGQNDAAVPSPQRRTTSTVAIGAHRVLGRTENVLLLGLDRNPGVRRGGLTDTLIVAALDEARGRLGLVSVPRDLYVEFGTHGRVRINAVYGLAGQAKRDPVEALGRVMQDTLGIPIHHTIAIDLGVLERAVDLLDGIELEVPCPIVDRFIDPRMDSGRRVLDVAAGRQLMDGKTVAMYVRSRHGRSDWDRSLRQQAVLVGFRERLLRGRSLLRLPRLVEEVEASIQTDLNRLQLLRLAHRVISVERQHLHGLVLGVKETVPMRTEQQWSVLLTDDEAVEQRLSDLFLARRPGVDTKECPPADVALRKRSKAASK